MSRTIPYYQARLPIQLYPRQIGELQNVIQGVVRRLKPDMEKARIAADLFHNHDEEGNNLIRFPLIQYQISGQNDEPKYATLTGIGEGADALKWLVRKMPKDVLWAGKKGLFIPAHSAEKDVPFVTSGKAMREYAIYEWLALSGNKGKKDKSNLETYLDTPDFARRVLLLQRILADHLRFAATGCGVSFKQPPVVVITEVTKITHTEIKTREHGWFSFSLTFAANWQLPDSMGIGNKAAIGFGKLQLLPQSIMKGQKRYERMKRLTVSNKKE